MRRTAFQVITGTLALVVGCLAATAALAATPEQQAADLLKTAGVHGGLVVHLGCGDGRLTAALGAGDAYVVHGLVRDAASVAKARDHLASKGLAGKVTVARLLGNRLPYVANLVGLLVADDLGGVPMAEVMRVLAPGGVALVGGKKTVKPRPDGIDDWTHYLHGPGNNAVADDTQVGPPRHVQWLAGPLWTRNHHKLNSVSSVVTAGGRLFTIVDEATAANMSVPGKWALVAHDAFSGVTLWKKPMGSWTWHLNRFRSGPPQVTRLLVTDGRRVYAPLGLSEPVSAVDAVTGKTLATYADTKGAEELILTGQTLLVLTGAPVAEHAFKHEAFRTAYRFPNQKRVVAVDTTSGQTRWQWSADGSAVRAETLASDGRRAYLQAGNSVVALDLASGKPAWQFGDASKKASAKKASAKKASAKKKPSRGAQVSFGTYTLVVADGVVLCNLSRTLTALSAETGKVLWQRPSGGGFHAPLDVFVINGLVWAGDHPKDSVAPPPVGDFCQALDLQTGQPTRINQVMVDLQTAGHHHRCYREKATSRFIITGKRGVEMMDLTGSGHSRNNWVRGTCQYGILPANGLLYAPPNSCGCYMESLLHGFYALAAEEPAADDAARRVPDEERLTCGPAHGQPIRNPKSEIPNGSSWPTYRHDPLRSGVAGTDLPAALTHTWKTDVGGRATQPVVADGVAVVAVTDARRVLALDAATGKVRWSHTAGGRIDSPPTLWRGRVLFGSADGRVTCLRLADGRVAWQFMAAPADLRTVAMDQVESLWPVHGSVLVLPGGGEDGKPVAYCAAGRSTWLDGGIHLYALDPSTGRVLHAARFRTDHPAFRRGKDQATDAQKMRIAQNTTDYKTFLQSDHSDSFSMAGGTISDVLVSNGADVFLHHVRFGPDLQRREVMSRHLFSTSSLLDDAENHRSHWVLGTGDFSRVPVAYSWIVNHPGRWSPGIAVPTGVAMVFTDQAVWGVQRQGDANGQYRMFRGPNAPLSPDGPSLPDFREPPKGTKRDSRTYQWQHDLPVRPRAILKAGDRLVLGVWPKDIPDDDPHAAYEGRLGGSLWLVSAADGTKTGEMSLEHPVVWDGLSAAGRRLYVSTIAGQVLCFGAK